jgi:hypothetical protein
MTNAKQFWALLKFQTKVNPFVWFVPIFLSAPLFITGTFLSWYHPSLHSVLGVQNLFFVGLVALWVLVPEIAQGGNSTRSAGTEFLLTRAVDRPIFYRSRAALFYVLVFLIPLVGLVLSLKTPDLKVTEYSNVAQQECLRNVRGSTLEADPSGGRSPLIAIPRGNVLVEEWHFWMYVITAVGAQTLLSLLYPLKYRTYIFYAVFLGIIFLPLAVGLREMRAATPTYMERLFFSFASHQAAFWTITALGLIWGQLWCERRFCRLEQTA